MATATPTLRQLRHFLSLARHGSFLRAAEECAITQPSLSASVKELEAILGVPLFDRGTRTVYLTGVGERLVPRAADVLERADDLVLFARRGVEPLNTPLTLGVIPTIAPYLLPHLLPYLQDHFSELDLSLRENTTPVQMAELADRKVDAVLMAFPFSTPDNVVHEILWKEQLLLLRHGKRKPGVNLPRPEDLKNETILLLDDGHCLRDHVLSACRLSPTPGARSRFGATSLQTLVQMVRCGYGVTVVPEMAVRQIPATRDIYAQFFVPPGITRLIGLAWREKDPREADFLALGRVIRTVCKTMRNSITV